MELKRNNTELKAAPSSSSSCTRVPGPVAIVSLETRKVNAVRIPPQNGVGDHHQTIVCVYGPTAMSVPTVPPKRGRKGGNA